MTNLNSSATNPNGQPASLLPCPFCGGEVELCVHEATGVSWVRCIECEASSGASSAAGATKAWNDRAERTCQIERRNSPWGGYTEHCGACGADLGCDTRNRQNYCPNCGAKVVE